MQRKSFLTPSHSSSFYKLVILWCRVLLLFALLAFASASQSETPTSVRCEQILKSSTDVIEKLQQEQPQKKSFITQGEADKLLNKGGSCGIVCALNLVQSLRVYSGLMPLENINAIAGHFIRENPLTANGSLTPSTLVDSLNYLFQNYNSGISTSIETVQLKLKDSVAEPNANFGKITLNSIRPKSDEFKIALIGTPLLGGHYVLMKSVQQDKVSVIEPNHPDKLSEFKVTSFKIQDHDNVDAMGWIPMDGNVLKFDANTFYVVLSVTTVKVVPRK